MLKVGLPYVGLSAVRLPMVAADYSDIQWPTLCQRGHLLAADGSHLLIDAAGGRLLI